MSIIERFTDLIALKIKDNLNNLFKNKEFCIYKKNIVYTIENTYFYENLNTNCLFFKEDLKENEEYLVYKIETYIKNTKFNELFYKNNFYSLYIYYYINNVIEFIYEPETPFNLIKNNTNNSEFTKLTKELYQEYLDVFNLFKDIRIYNYNNNYKLTFSLNGKLYNRPDREYFIVMNNNYDYNIQVYKINNENKREKMLFGIWMDISPCGKEIKSEPFFFMELN